MKSLVTGLLAAALTGSGVLAQSPGLTALAIDPGSPGRTFEGIGALSAGASSRLLIDYPEPQRSDILDILFKPGFAASLQHLKVELGGDINSTDGSEPAWARTREEFTRPRDGQFDRGYEWWLMKEARRRNPSIFLDVLQWGAPPWIGSVSPGAGAPPAARFFSQDNADFITGYIEGIRSHHDLVIDYCGIWNETPYDTAWITTLRRTLDRHGLGGVRIVAADQTPGVASSWTIADEVLTDGDLAKAVHAIGVHYASSTGWKYALKEPYASTPEAKRTGKPLWASEDGPWRGDWEGARALAKIFNRSYAVGRMTKTVIWSLISSYLDNLPIAGSGPMKANTPWSGHYEIQPAVWAIAHTTQFARPGWRYIDSASRLFPRGGSSVALVSPDGRDWSLIVETMDAKGPETLSIAAAGTLKEVPLTIWRTTRNSQFEMIGPLSPAGGLYTIVLEPEAVYSLTTTEGQHKGVPAHPIPPDHDLVLPFTDDFERTAPGRAPGYFSDLNGAFEVVTDSGKGGGRALRQTISERGIEWPLAGQPEPRTIVGSRSWSSYEVSSDIHLEGTGWAGVCARYGRPWESGCWLKLFSDGSWQFTGAGGTLDEGRLAEFDPGVWHTVSLWCSGTRVIASIDGIARDTSADYYCLSGFAALGTGWNMALFDNFSVRQVPGRAFINLAGGKKALASSTWSGDFDGRCAVDGDPATRWNAAEGKAAGEYLEIDLGRTAGFNLIRVSQFEPRIGKYVIRGFEDGIWHDLVRGDARGRAEWTDVLLYAHASRVRLVVLSTASGDAASGTPSVSELELYDTL